MENKQTAVEWLEELLHFECKYSLNNEVIINYDVLDNIIMKSKQMEKEQALGLMSDACMFFAASFHDHDLKVITYEDVYNKYYNGK
jgi:hypothetical protein